MPCDLPMRRQPIIVALATLVALASVGATWADEWLVYLGGGLEPIEDGWEQRRGQVLFRKTGGTLVSIPYADVDLATSAFISWQLSGRTEIPPRGPLPEPAPSGSGANRPCVAAKVVGLIDSETLEISIGRERETVHVACLDAPDTRHKFSELGWFGRAALSALQIDVHGGDEICVTEQLPPQRDREGHRVVFLTLADGKDYAALAIAGGLGLLRLGPCARAAGYRKLEDQAIAGERGLWGPSGTKAAFAAANNSIAIGAGDVGAPPPRRVGGG